MLLLATLYTFWPVLLAGAVAMVAAAWFVRGTVLRVLALAAACVLGLGGLAGGMLAADQRRVDARAAAYNARLNERLQAETMIDGVAFPSGTQVLWMEPSHLRLVEARMPRPTDVRGTMAVYARREFDGWHLETERPQEVDGWPCDKGAVTLEPNGSLRTCVLSRQAEWNGWTLPARTSITPRHPGDLFSVTLPQDAVVFAREIGRTLPSTPAFNLDGSLHSVMYDNDTPTVVRGVALCCHLRWRYDPATLGMGRDRPPVAVEGTAVSMREGKVSYDGRVVVRLADGTVTQE